MAINDRFKKIRKTLDLNQTTFSKILGVAQANLSKYESGELNIPDKVKMALSKEYDINIHWLLTGEGEMFTSDLKKNPEEVPIIDRASLPENSFLIPYIEQELSAGYGTELLEIESIQSLIQVPAYLHRFRDKLVAVTVRGDSMEPTLRNGDIIICDSLGWDGEGIYAITMEGQGYVKRIAKRPQKVLIQSDNPIYTPYEISAEEVGENGSLQVIGRVRCIIKQF